MQTVVGLGGSAGSIRALQAFFSRMPGDSGLAFVVVLHLSPEFESSLAALLQKSTAMPVTQVTEPTTIEANRVYVIRRASTFNGRWATDAWPRRTDPTQPQSSFQVWTATALSESSGSKRMVD